MSHDGTKGSVVDSDAGMLNLACFDLMLIELVPMAERVAQQLYERSISSNSTLAKVGPAVSASKPNDPGNQPPFVPASDEDEMREAVHDRLETLGYRVGLGVVESLSAQAPLPSSSAPLDTIKFLCKDIWTTVFRKQIDNLKTNHRGVFVLTDNSFAPLRRCSLPAGMAEEARRRAVPFLQFPTGLVRGALSGLGMETQISVEVQSGGVPGVNVTVKVLGAVGGR